MPVPYTFANQIGNIALSELDANFANVKAAADTAATVTASAQPAITSVGQLTSLGVLGNISTSLGGVYSPGFYYPNGVSILSGISSGGSSSYGNANVASYLPVYDGSLVSLAGNVTTTADVNAAKGVFSSTLTTSGNITTSANIYASRNITGQTLTSQGAITGTAVTATAGDITTTGGNVVGLNITTAGNVIASGRLQAPAVLSTGTIQGSDLYSTGLLRGANLSISGSGTVTGDLTVSGTIYTSAPAFIATITSSTGQGLLTSPSSIREQSLVFNSVSQNIGNGYTAGVFTAPTAGFYQVSAACAVTPTSWASVPSYYGEAVLGIYKNGLPVATGNFVEMRGASINGVLLQAIIPSSISTLVYLNAGDTLQCKLAYISDAPTNFWYTYANVVPNYFQACWLRS